MVLLVFFLAKLASLSASKRLLLPSSDIKSGGMKKAPLGGGERKEEKGKGEEKEGAVLPTGIFLNPNSQIWHVSS